ncbi:alkylhydroperoxidase [Vibrio parahaemolyticus]|nr:MULTISPECIES: carboxymuconolactone decarboxylase family protein [Vibrio]EGQ7819231.1 carboxymuconolactone decarboxylase family protein [Vibrio parahaemolyticus]EGQ8705200.1 carboxymuconolactone decarboxylase family protein [Vibrio parahaemolyticus]EGQ8941587.1 carboxymuconolactone decarboxylase family protein [Vibrio parahaemolyticus]EGQ8948318.1 carboxymuconolactone decarboxylase family protein [Vibrio parahaemolyticus]EGQ8967467.1 carboxymuconolactone decarboxylase family protein [Vibrio 
MKSFKLRTIQTADELAAPILTDFKKKYGMIPNFYAALGIDGVSLRGYLDFEQSLEDFGSLTARQRELISLCVAYYNKCHYCVSGHTFSAKKIGLSSQECADAQKAKATNLGDQAILSLARTVLEKQGHLSKEDVDSALAHGLTEGQIIQICAWTALNTFSNWVNNITQPKIDFPKVDFA